MPAPAKRFLFAVVLVLAVLSLAERKAAAATPVNPEVRGGTLYWRYNGQNREEGLLRFERWYIDREPWDGCVTKAGNRYEHMHITSSFPYTSVKYNIPPYAQPPITAAMVEAYWDTMYPAPNYSKSGSVDQTYNCHGYSTDYNGSWLTVDGMGDVLEAEYMNEYSVEDVLDYREAPDHSKKLFDLYWNPMQPDVIHIGRTRQKYRDSPIYQRIYADKHLNELSGWRRNS